LDIVLVVAVEIQLGLAIVIVAIVMVLIVVDNNIRYELVASSPRLEERLPVLMDLRLNLLITERQLAHVLDGVHLLGIILPFKVLVFYVFEDNLLVGIRGGWILEFVLEIVGGLGVVTLVLEKFQGQIVDAKVILRLVSQSVRVVHL
jgi:hypothetical protein